MDQKEQQESWARHLECPICMALFVKPVTIQCGHNFCQKCILEYLKSTPKCPVCREVIVTRPDGYKENRLINQMIEELKKIGYKEQVQSLYQQERPPQLDSQKYIILTTDNFLIPYTYQRITLHKQQFPQLNTNQIRQFLHDGQVIIQSKQGQVLSGAMLVKIQQLIPSMDQIQAQVLSIERIEIQNIETQDFEIGENPRIVFQLQLGNSVIVQDELLDLNDNEIKSQIQTLSQNIVNFITHIFSHQQLLDQTTVVIQQQLTRTGLFQLMEQIENLSSLKKLSFLLPGILKIPQIEKVRITQSNNLIQRLMLIQKSLNRFQDIHNPLVIFQLEDQSRLSTHHKELVITAIIVIFLLLMYF